MLFALLLVASLADWVPARWTSADPKSLEIVAQTPVNCLLLEQNQWAQPFVAAAAQRGMVTLAVLHPGGDPVEGARRALANKLNGVVLEGPFDAKVARALADSKILTLELPPRRAIRFDRTNGIIGTDQGVWPGIQIQEGGEAKSAPSGGPWIDTNTGFLRFARASTSLPVWIANRPPEKTVIPVERYLQAIGDAEMTGAHWVIALDSDFDRKLQARDPKALQDWKRMGAQLKFYQDHKEWRELQPRGTLALLEDAASGALLSGGVLDMIAVKHTPVRPVPNAKLTPVSITGAKMAVEVDPASLTQGQKEVLKAFTRGGGTLLTGPPGWKFPAPQGDQITLGKDDLAKLDEIWKEVNSLTGRKNLGARLFNVSSMLSNLLEMPGGSPVVLQLVNYSDYPVDSVTVHLLGKFKQATLLTPEAGPKPLQLYEVEEGTGVDIDKITAVASVVLQ